MTRSITILTTLLLALPVAPAVAQVTAAPGFTIDTIATPGVVQGDVVRAGTAVLVGQGDFGPGLQHIVRLDDAGATVIADGFGGLGGFSLAADGTLYVVDNCFVADFGCAAATTGDTVYAIPDALGRSTAIAAADAEILPAGSIGFAFDVLATDDGLFVSDAVGPGAGRVVRVAGGAAVDVITGLGFVAGLALDGATLLVGESDEFFVGTVSRYTRGGAFLETVASGLSGAFGVDVDPLRSDVLLTGGFAPDFSSTLAAVGPVGTVADRASGFGFTAGLFHDRIRDETLVLDFGATEVALVCPDPDGNEECNTPCPVPASALTSKLLFGNLTAPPGTHKVTLKGTADVAAPSTVDPPADGLRLLVMSADGVPVVDAIVPGGAFDKSTKTGWKTNKRGDAFGYKNPDGIAGFTLVRVKVPSDGGPVRFVAKGKQRATFTNAANAAHPLKARVAFANGETCIDAAFDACASKKGGKILKCL